MPYLVEIVGDDGRTDRQLIEEKRSPKIAIFRLGCVRKLVLLIVPTSEFLVNGRFAPEVVGREYLREPDCPVGTRTTAGIYGANQPSAQRIIFGMNCLKGFAMLRQESQWFDSVCRL